ncbi:hypothetical protein HO173_005054 [Letharia columbiana]|uniref:Uncharacterized protein n=1 Tax=Letharia columbiana TaxID=112416 RepID=A0A8H6FXU8_9LECA|nr:uncharacterized protein HO173_005054 [Letharia columbiana]KAF6236763.1 hypothetical protein HO173_005054 [Letharia columbiana]
MGSPNQEYLGQRLSAEHRTSNWDHKPQAIVYDPSLDKFETVERQNLNTDCNSFPVHLPWWRNKVDIYLDPENRSGFVATVKLDRLGAAKNWQRRLRHNYKVLHVKGLKPGTASRASSSSSTSIPVVKHGDHSV